MLRWFNALVPVAADVPHSPNVGSPFMKFHRYALKLFYLKQLKCLLYFLYFLLSHISSLSIFNTIRFDHNSCKYIFYLNYSICLWYTIAFQIEENRLWQIYFKNKSNFIDWIIFTKCSETEFWTEKDKCPYALPYDISGWTVLYYSMHDIDLWIRYRLQSSNHNRFFRLIFNFRK